MDIAIGVSAKSKKWKNEDISWSDLVDRLVNTTRTTEKFTDYMRMSKTDQGAVKDRGGFVGGYLRGSRRQAQNLIHRQLLTLDLDFADLDFWDTFTMMYGEEAVMHTTHKHRNDSPRYRLIIPLDREVSPDEYEAISRAVAGTLDIEAFDPTTFQPIRMMFWPTTSTDGTFVSEHQKGDYLNADEVLSTYADWRDTSLWPVHSKSDEIVRNEAKKQEDPATKKGVIGAFCRAYSIEEAIDELLTDKYIPTKDGRYTYVEGTAASGLVTYDDKFAFSHHGTDPASGKLCNAFDLVRLHKFGGLDNGNSDSTTSKSFKAMQQFARDNDKTRKIIAAERIEVTSYEFADKIDAKDEFADDIEEAGDETIELDVSWMANLDVDNQGRYTPTEANINTILRNDAALKQLFVFNEFDGGQYIQRSAPWRAIREPERMRNVDYAGLRNYIGTIYGISSSQKIEDSLTVEFERNKIHTVKEYLEATNWDGVKRIDTFLPDYLGAENSVYTVAAMRNFLVGAVKRIYRAGCKFDTVLTLVGEQGTGKSTFCSKLGGAFASDTFMTVHGKEALEQIQGVWIIEMAELAGLRKSDVESIKHFISKRIDTFRPAYARTVETYKRQCVFVATTNKYDFLRDRTGDRRFNPVTVDIPSANKSIFDLSEGEVAQIWAEAKTAYDAGEDTYMTDEALAMSRIKQEEHGEIDSREGIINDYLDMLVPENWDELDIYERRDYYNRGVYEGKQRDNVCIAEIWTECIGKVKEDITRQNSVDIGGIITGLKGWKRGKKRRFRHFGVQASFTRLKNNFNFSSK